MTKEVTINEVLELSEENISKNNIKNKSLVERRRNIDNTKNSEKSSFNLPENRFDVTGNENLTESGTVFFG